jgi:flagellar P-ring protein precursor FlgI
VPPVSLAEPIRPFTDETQYFRIKDITFVDGDRDNRVDGIGLVTGLSATGGRAAQTRIMAQNFLLRKGVSVQTPETRSMSAVLVNGAIPPYGRQGEKFQVSVSVMDDATSLRGGTLTRTPLRGLDGQIYAFAEGQVLGGGVAAGGQAANVQRDHPTVGVCTAIIEREICADQMTCQNALRLVLRNKDYSTAVSIANALNDIFPGSSRAVDSGAVALVVPYVYHGKLPELIATIGSLAVRVDPPARVVINQKTGTIIMGQHVRLSPVVFAKGSLVIATAESPVASQPLPFSKGETVVLPRSDVDVRETGGPYSSLGGGATVGELGRALNELGFTPNMMIEMFSSLQRIGALQAELIIE